MLNKKVNTMLFILGATVFNILVTIISLVLLLILCGRYIVPLMGENNVSWVFSIVFIFSIVISIFVYRVVLKQLLKKIDVEKYFDPLFARKYKKPQ